MTKPRPVKQCKKCPWRKGADVNAIPSYDRGLHCKLAGTIADPNGDPMQALRSPTLRIMACHDSKPGRDTACAGWLDNQCGVGNNLAVRLAVATGRLPAPIVDGPQHESFEATLEES